MRVLITAGATREKIDGVRFITNFSTGNTAVAIAQYFLENSHEIHYYYGIGSQKPLNAHCFVEFFDFQDLDHKLKLALNKNKFDIIIHLAAVSDFSVHSLEIDNKSFTSSEINKIKSSSIASDKITLILKKNYKILNKLRDYSYIDGKFYDPFIIAFKLTNMASEKEIIDSVNDLRKSQVVNLIVQNDLSEINLKDKRKFYIYDNKNLLKTCYCCENLSKNLLELYYLKKYLSLEVNNLEELKNDINT